MNTHPVSVIVDSFTVVGFQTRTSNCLEMAGRGAISSIWARLKAENLPRTQLVALYTDYESDRNGEYGYILGLKSGLLNENLSGSVSCNVPAGSYLVFKSEIDHSPQAVLSLWKQIWELEDSHDILRSYKTDFEVYEGPRLGIYVGVKA